MIEIDFKDRVPNHPGRIELIPVDGQPNIFDMARADDPLVDGTPINKALLQSFTHSRLTGRYYDMTASKTTLSSAGGATNPIPTSWSNTTSTSANSGSYSISASGSSGSAHPHRAFDGLTNTNWISDTNKEPWIRLNVPDGIIVKKMKIAFRQPESWSTQTVLQGLLSDGSWANLATISLPSSSSLIEYNLSSPSSYKAYRLKFTIYQADVIELYEWQISDWSTATYRYDYTISSGVPGTWTKGQRITVQVPNVSTVGVTSNIFNGITVNTILQPNKKYELVYNGSRFDAKEV